MMKFHERYGLGKEKFKTFVANIRTFNFARFFQPKLLSTLVVLLTLPLLLLLTRQQENFFTRAYNAANGSIPYKVQNNTLIRIPSGIFNTPSNPSRHVFLSAVRQPGGTVFEDTSGVTAVMNNSSYQSGPPDDATRYTPLSIPTQGQSNLQDCVAWAIGYYMKGWYAKRSGYYPGSDSNYTGSFSPAFIYSQRNKPQIDGMNPEEALTLLIAHGIDTRLDYTQGDANATTPPTAAELLNASRYKMKSYKVVFNREIWDDSSLHKNIKNIIIANIISHHPLVIDFPVFEQFYAAGKNNFFIDNIQYKKADVIGSHEVFAPSYDKNGVWVINSWGPGFGYNGWVLLSWNFVERYVYHGVIAEDKLPTPPQKDTCTSSIRNGTCQNLLKSHGVCLGKTSEMASLNTTCPEDAICCVPIIPTPTPTINYTPPIIIIQSPAGKASLPTPTPSSTSNTFSSPTKPSCQETCVARGICNSNDGVIVSGTCPSTQVCCKL